MKWEHHASKTWMEARQQDLTFSDVKSLIPVTATGRPRKITDEDYMKVYGSAFEIIDDDSCTSYGAAARGHIMEPYAVELFNKTLHPPFNHMFHWDDMVLWSSTNLGGAIAFSPDGLDVPMSEIDEEDLQECYANVSDLRTAPTRMLEIKSYDTGKHLICAHTPKEKLQERWQVAYGMLVCSTIEEGYVMFFDPRCADGSGFVHHYYRYELKEEIDILKEAVSGYYKWLHEFVQNPPAINDSLTPSMNLGLNSKLGLPNEEEIHREYLASKENSLDPF